MPLNAGGPGYGSLSSPVFSGSVGSSEGAPLLIPEDEPEEREWRPLSREQLEEAAGGPGWRRFRFYLVLLFWLSWMAMLATAVAILVVSPKPVARPLKWWQKSLFYQLQPELVLEATMEGSPSISALCEEFLYLRSLGVGALILEGLFGKDLSPVNVSATAIGSATLPLIQYMLKESSKSDIKVVLDFCDVDLLGSQDGGEYTGDTSVKVKDALRFWLAQGVSGFTICDTDETYSEKSLLEWRDVLKEFNTEEERIMLVKQTRDTLTPLDTSTPNITLVDVVIKSILPISLHLLSGQEVASAIESHLYRAEEDQIWNSWMLGGKASDKLKKLLLVLLMTLPGSPAVEQDSDIDQSENISLNLAAFGENSKSDTPNKDKERHLSQALFTSLSQSRSREEALLYGSFTFLPVNTNFSNSTVSSPPLLLAYLRSWGCVHFLILLNVGSEPHLPDPGWASSLPEAGVFVASSGMDRMGSTSLDTLVVQPHEAIVIKLFEAGAYS